MRVFLRMLLLLPGMFLSTVSSADIEVRNPQMTLVFSDRGDLVSVTSCIPSCADRLARTMTLSPQDGFMRLEPAQGEGENPAPPVSLTGPAGSTLWEFSRPGDGVVRWIVPEQGWLLRMESSVPIRASLNSDASFVANDGTGFARWIGRTRYLALADGLVQIKPVDESYDMEFSGPGWAGFRNRNWAMAVRLEDRAGVEVGQKPKAIARLDMGDEAPLSGFDLYAGPVEPGALRNTAPELGKLMYSGLWAPLRWICFALYALLGLIQGVIGHWGYSIMLLSLAVSLLMRPLTKIAERLQHQVQTTEARLAPAINEIKSRLKGEEQSEAVLALYKAENVHPLYSLKSLVGVMVVIPVFIGAFDMLAENIWLSGESFLWITDLSRPDSVTTLPWTMGFLGNQLNILPFIMTILSIISSWLHQHSSEDEALHSKQLRRLFLMAVGFWVLFYTFPAGMVLYWTTNNLISVIKGVYRRGHAAD